MGKVISTHTTSTTWSTSTTAYFLWQNGDSTYYKTELYTIISTLSSQVGLKANSAQSTWINVTYSSNWVDFSTTYPPTSYMKDTLGFVHLRVNCKTGASNPIANLPANYIPNYTMSYTCYSINVSTAYVPLILVTSSGGIQVYNYTNTYVYLGEVLFSTT
jgi:hypothetical protein